MTDRPVQWREDVAEILAAYDAGGPALATSTYNAIVEARKLVRWTALALAEDFRAELRRKIWRT